MQKKKKVDISSPLLCFSIPAPQKNETTPMQRRHERKKEKRKKSARLQVQDQDHQELEENLEQNLDQDQDQSQAQAGTTEQAEDAHIKSPPTETSPAQTEKPQKTVIKTEPKTPKASVAAVPPRQPL